MLKQFKKYLKVWWKITFVWFRADLTNRVAAALFIFGKMARFLFFLGFLVLLVSNTKTLAGYSLNQVIFFFLTFNLIDILVQLFLRGVYHFRPLIVTGGFDSLLVKPISPLFSSLTAHADVLDLITLVPLIGYLIFFLMSGQVTFNSLGIVLYLLLIIVSFIIALALHIAVIAFGVLTTEVDHLVWMYRDFSGMARIPIDIYREWIRSFLVFVVPVGVIMTFPAKALLGLLAWPWMVFAFLLAAVLLFLSLRFWNFALKRYSSASS